MHRGRGGSRVVALAAMGLGALLCLAPGAVADDGLRVGSDSRFSVDEPARLVAGHMELKVANVKPDPPGGYYFYNTLTFVVPAAIGEVRATANGSGVRVTRGPGPDSRTQTLTVALPYDLRFGQSITIMIDFTMSAGVARSETSTRVGPGYASFEVFGVGDPGSTRVTIERPIGSKLDASDPSFREVSNESAVSSGTNNSPGGIAAMISIREPSAFRSETVNVGPAVFHVEPWPDDPDWGSRVKEGLITGVPALAELVGSPWPTSGTTLREDAVVNVMGFDGWYDSNARELVLGEQAEPHVIYHELAHAWMNGATFENRWVYEGLAEWLATQTVIATGATALEQETVSPDGEGAIRLTDWQSPEGGRSLPGDSFAYPAARLAMAGVLDDMSTGEVAALLTAALKGERPFPAALPSGNGSSEATAKVPLTDRAFLDLLEVDAPHPKAVEAYRTWVLEPADVDKLAARTDAYAVFREIEALDGDWHPHAMSVAMADWDFAAAADAAPSDRATAALAGQALAAAKRAAVTLPPAMRTAYEQGELDVAKLTTARAALTDLVAARASTQNPIAEITAPLLGVSGQREQAVAALETGDFATAAKAAATAKQRAGLATVAGLGVIGLLALSLLLAVAALLRARTRRASARRARARQLATVSDDQSFSAQVSQEG
ncbi:MAG TPA: hypothetical protein PLU83_06135 [Phycicoccus sp.]|nr:hypothetical protein [Phycicoccus sp.]